MVLSLTQPVEGPIGLELNKYPLEVGTCSFLSLNISRDASQEREEESPSCATEGEDKGDKGLENMIGPRFFPSEKIFFDLFLKNYYVT